MTSKEDIVISGIAGRLPECDNVEEFWKALYDGIDLMSTDDRRYPPGFEGTPKRTGKIRNVEHFDAAFFGCNPKLSNFMDPRHRILLETAYECVVDAGYNPKELRGSKTGVYVGITSYDDSEELKRMRTDGNYLAGTYLAMAANRISYVFDFHGPSYTCDSACSSSLYAFVHAFNDLNSGIIDYALVGATQLNLNPNLSMEFAKLNVTSPEGMLKTFSADRSGYVRSEAVVAFLLQKKTNCKRAYALVAGGRTNSDGYKKEGISFPSFERHIALLEDTYSHFKINRDDVTYIEAHGTGTKVGDLVECTAISEFFCKNRKEPLLVGSVKTNIGHSEISSGLCAILKVLGILRTGIIPGNLNSEPIDNTLPGIRDGKLKVVTQNMSYKRGLIGLSNLGYGGANAHVVIKPYTQYLQNGYLQHKRRLVLVSGRTIEAVEHFLNRVQENQEDREFLALVDEIHKINITGHNYRGYVVLGDEPALEKEKISAASPVWFIYTGMGCQWPAMGRDLLKFDVFRNTFDRCASALRPYDIDLYDVVTSNDPFIFSDIRHSFTAISAIQIALTDVLRSLGILPDRFAGYSVGEVACGYADGTLTPEQAVLCAFARGHACHQVKNDIIKGAMAAVELPKTELLTILPKGVYVGCRNSSSSVTLTGPEKITREFVEDLQSKGIFARMVETNGIAFHSEYVHEAGTYVLKFLRKVIRNPQQRSSKWISSSVLPEDGHKEWAQYNSPEYQYNNFCNPVLFDQVLQEIPNNAVVIEIAPHGLLQAILKRELPSTVTNIFLVNKRYRDNEEFFLSALGRLYLAGCQPQISKFYPEVKFPVGAKSATISSSIKWDHSVSWLVPKYVSKDSFCQSIIVNISDPEWSYLQGHVIDGRVLMPAATYVMLVWQVFSKIHSESKENFPVVMKTITFPRAILLLPNTDITFYVNILKHSGDFEISENNSIVAKGKIELLEYYKYDHDTFEETTGSEIITKNDFYKEINLRRYNYKDIFRCINGYDLKKNEANISWCDKYDCFLDGMLQIGIVDLLNNRDLRVPTFVEKLVFDPVAFRTEVGCNDGVSVFFNKRDIIKCPGLELYGLVFTKKSGKQNEQRDPLLEIQKFVPYEAQINSNNYSFQTSLTIALEILLQNCHGFVREISICEILSESSKTDLMSYVSEILSKKPLVTSSYTKSDYASLKGKYDVIILEGYMNSSFLENLYDDGFIIFKGTLLHINKNIPFDIVFHSNISADGLFLLRKRAIIPKEQLVFVNVINDFNWIDELKLHMKEENPKFVYLVSQCDKLSGIVGLTNCLKTEPSNCKFRFIFTDNKFSIDDNFYKNQIKKNLVYNILRRKKWGTYVYLPFEEIVEREVSNARINIRTVGNLASIEWVQAPTIYNGPHENTASAFIFYSSLNFKDVMLATGKMQYFLPNLPPTAPNILLGMEFSGISEGKRIMGICNYNGIALQCKVDRNLMWEIPDQWSLEDAATVPLVFATVYYSLIMRGHLQPGESILIHAGTGAVGMAAISLALSLGCEIFTTVSKNEKKEFLRQMFPRLKDENFGNTRDKSFERVVMKRTKGRGVDIVLNSLAGEMFDASLRCLSEGGRFLELGKVEFFNRKQLDSHMFLKNCSFHGILLEHVFYGAVKINTRLLHELVINGINSGVVKPLPRTVFQENQVEEAFRFLTTGKHIGKVLIQIRKEENEVATSLSRTISAIPKIYFNPRKSYIITGGLGGVGLELANWMITKGATKIVLNSRRGITNGYQTLCLAKWQKLEGIQVVICTINSSFISKATELIKAAEILGPVGGVFNLAVELKDKLFINQRREDFQVVFNSKLESVRNLDQVTRTSCRELDLFVVFSSMASGLGNIGQTNYGMANSILERLCEERISDNLPGLVVQYGLIGEVGLIQNLNDHTPLHQFTEPQQIPSCLNTLEKCMLQAQPIILSILGDKKEISANTEKKSVAEAVSHILGIKDISNVDPSSTLVQLGMDSLMSAEIKQTLYKEYEIDKDNRSIQELTFGILLNWNSVSSKFNSESMNQRAKFRK